MNTAYRGWRVRLVVIVAGSLLILLCLLMRRAPVVIADPGDDPGKDHRLGTGQMHLQFQLDQQDRLRSSASRPSGMTQAQGWTSLLSENFEGGFPGTVWSLYGDPTWGERGYRKYAGEFSGYAVGGGDHGVQPPGPYPNNVDSWMVAGPFDLTDATDAQILFHSWIDTEYRSEDEYDAFMIFASVDGEDWWGDYWYGDWTGPDGCNGWCNDPFDLTDVYHLGNLCGQPEVWIAFGFESNSNSSNDEGVYVDDIEVRAKFSDDTIHSSIFLPVVWKTEASESETGQVTSSQGAVISTQSGTQLQVHAGTVPHRADGSAGTTTFSIETNAHPPAPLPADVRAVSSVVKFGPDGFVFAEPVGMSLPVPSVHDKAKLNLLRYQPGEGKWLRYPMSIDENSVTVAGYDLGYTVVTTPSLSAERSSLNDTSDGAFYWGRTSCPVGGGECWYYFTIIKATLKYPEQWAPWGEDPSCEFPLQPWRCFTMKTGSSRGASWPQCYESVGGLSNECVFTLPQGDYELCVTAFEAPINLTTPGKWTYSKRGIADLGDAAHFDYFGGGVWRGAVPLELENGGVWGTADVVPCPSPSPTIPVGTGQLQATLTWVNTASEATDLDLHLYGPGGLHIYWNNQGPQDNLTLDRDWQTQEGSAIENIYSVGAPLPRGSYRLTVKHYSDNDPPKSYTVRFIFQGSSSTYTKNITTGEQVITEFTVD